MIPDVVRRVAVRDLPEDLALVQADGADAAVGRLHDRQALNREAAAAAPFAARRRLDLPAAPPAPPVPRLGAAGAPGATVTGSLPGAAPIGTAARAPVSALPWM